MIFTHTLYNMCKLRKANPIKTSDTLDFSIKSSFAFSAASQVSLSILFSAEATATSFCMKKEQALKLGNNQFSTL